MTTPAPLLRSLQNLPMYPSGTNSPLSMSGPNLVSEINIKSESQYSAIDTNSAFLLAMQLALITKVRQLLSSLGTVLSEYGTVEPSEEFSVGVSIVGKTRSGVTIDEQVGGSKLGVENVFRA